MTPRAHSLVGIAAPSGWLAPQQLGAGLRVLESLGLRWRMAPVVPEDFLAGSDELRAQGFKELLADPDVGVVMCARGGVGASALLSHITPAQIAGASKPIIGFSDASALVLAAASAGSRAVHGPVVAQLPWLDRPSLLALAELLRGRQPWPVELRGWGLKGARAQGPIVAGNLSIICHMLSSPWFPAVEGAVLVLEEVGEAPYRVERMLIELELAGVFDKVVAVVLGWLDRYEPMPPAIAKVVQRRLESVEVVVAGVGVGHGPQNMVLALGARAVVDAQRGVVVVEGW